MLIINNQCISLCFDFWFVYFYITAVHKILLFYNFMEYFSFGRPFIGTLDLVDLSNCEGSSLIYLTKNFDFATHLFDYFLTNTKAQTGSLTINAGVLIEFAKINE